MGKKCCEMNYFLYFCRLKNVCFNSFRIMKYLLRKHFLAFAAVAGLATVLLLSFTVQTSPRHASAGNGVSVQQVDEELLVGVKWRLTNLWDITDSLPDSQGYTWSAKTWIKFNQNQTVVGRGVSNDLHGRYSLEEDSVSFKIGVLTYASDRWGYEKAFLNVLNNNTFKCEVDSAELKLIYADGKVLKFERMDK